MNITSTDIAGTKEKVKLLNDYYAEAEAFEKKYRISSQSKFRSTILEEFNGYLLRMWRKSEN